MFYSVFIAYFSAVCVAIPHTETIQRDTFGAIAATVSAGCNSGFGLVRTFPAGREFVGDIVNI
jgi:hypothetical protein